MTLKLRRFSSRLRPGWLQLADLQHHLSLDVLRLIASSSAPKTPQEEAEQI